MRIRPPRLDESAALAALSGALGYPADPAEMAERLDKLRTRSDHCVFVVEDLDGVAQGWIHGMEQIALESGSWAEIMGLVVAREARGGGVGRALVATVEAWARERGLTMIKVRSNVARAESHPFYERLGYARFKTQHIYRRPL